MKNFRGSFVALITPFKNGRVDLKALQKLVEWHVRSGTHGIVPCGTTGESPTLSHEEHKNVIAACVEASARRIPVIAGTGSNSTEEAVALTTFAKKAGADAVLSVVPYYNKPTQQGSYQHFSAIASRAGMPIVLYNIPSRCGTALSAKTIVDLARLPEIVAIKEATGSMDLTSEILATSELSVLSGDDSLTLPLMSLGATGVISVFANIFPADIARMVNAFSEGNISAAQDFHYRIFPLCRALFIETNPIPIKTAMRMLKLDNGDLRLPLCAMDQENAKILKAELDKYIRSKIGTTR